jgi:hypothetical protein
MWWARLLNTISGIHGFTAPAPTSPVSGSKLWLDTSDASTFTYSSGTLVSQWNDKSGNGYVFTQASTSRQPSRNGTQNGLTTLIFDGTDDGVISTAAISTWKFLHDGSGSTVFAVAKQTFTSDYTRGSLLSTYDYQNSNFIGVGLQYGRYSSSTSSVHSGLTYRGVNGSYVDNDVFNNVNGNQYSVITYNYDTNNASDASKLPGYLNNGSVDGSNAVSWGASSTANSTGNLRFGIDSFSLSPFKGEMAEILIYTSILSSTDRNANIAYLKAKWGI